MPDDRAHHLAVRDAPEQIVRGVSEAVRRDPSLGPARRARLVEHVAKRSALVERPLLGREDPSRRDAHAARERTLLRRIRSRPLRCARSADTRRPARRVSATPVPSPAPAATLTAPEIGPARWSPSLRAWPSTSARAAVQVAFPRELLEGQTALALRVQDAACFVLRPLTSMCHAGAHDRSGPFAATGSISVRLRFAAAIAFSEWAEFDQIVGSRATKPDQVVGDPCDVRG